MIHTPPKRQPFKLQNLRVQVLTVFAGIVGAVIIGRLFIVQVMSHDYYTALAAGQHQLYEKLVPKRGRIFVRDNSNQLVPVADNQSLYLVYAVPNIIENPDETSKKLAQILGIPEVPPTPAPEVKDTKLQPKPDTGVIQDDSESLRAVNVTFQQLSDKIHRTDDKYEVLVRQVTQEVADKIADAKMTGIRLQSEDMRFYPENSLAAQVIGFYGFNGDKKVGSYGVEGYYDDILNGKDGSLLAERDTSGRWISIGNKTIEPAQNGADIVLTIDRAVQYKAEEIAKAAKEKFVADSVNIIVMDPMTGKIRAMANYPNFNSNEYGKVDDPSVYKNGTITDAYEPGSTFKPIMMAAALDAGLVQPDTTFINTGSVKIGKFTIDNVDKSKSGVTTMTEVLERSLNTGMVFVMEKLGKEKTYQYLQAFGIDKPTGITLDKEGDSLLSDYHNWSESQLATIGFGQGIATTEIHMAAAVAALANGGKLLEPQIVDEIRYSDGRVDTIQPKVLGQPISAATSLKISAMLVSSTQKGFAKAAKIDGYNLAGKTGTAQVAINGTYNNNEKITSFFMYGPVEDPKFLTFIRVNRPQKGRFAEDTAAPSIKELDQFLINYYRIPPTGATTPTKK